MTIISHKTLKLIKILVFSLVIFMQIASGNAKSKEGAKEYKMKSPYGETVVLSLALTRSQHTQGLSGMSSKQFPNTHGMLFVNADMSPRKFWMPDTYFNLDIIFLDQDLKIVGIEKNVPAHPGSTEPPEIYKTQIYLAQYILETKALAPFGKKLKKNDQLKFSGPSSLSEIAPGTRL